MNNRQNHIRIFFGVVSLILVGLGVRLYYGYYPSIPMDAIGAIEGTDGPWTDLNALLNKSDLQGINDFEREYSQNENIFPTAKSFLFAQSQLVQLVLLPDSKDGGPRRAFTRQIVRMVKPVRVTGDVFIIWEKSNRVWKMEHVISTIPGVPSTWNESRRSGVPSSTSGFVPNNRHFESGESKNPSK